VVKIVSAFADDIELGLEEALAYRRHAITDDHRCLDIID
jgi:hypothetical protein